MFFNSKRKDKGSGSITVTLQNDKGVVIATEDVKAEVAPYGRITASTALQMPEVTGEYEIIAAVEVSGKTVRSCRKVQFKSTEELGLQFGKKRIAKHIRYSPLVMPGSGRTNTLKRTVMVAKTQ